ncbi:hypothetical protein SDC9_60074 [bioreactor metagenome]|uniref:DUF4015 domain-containing protein n=1 Tax=bioreactor metagenome TaxID=1076179 RepID=A0A644XBZ8_9ZZZZ
MAKSGGYGSYRGRSPLRTFLKTVIILLSAVLVLGVIALVFFQQYIVYSSDGIRLELPFFTQPSPTAPQSSAAPVDSQPPVVETPQIIEPEWLHAVYMPASALYDGTVQSLVAAAGGNAAVFDMKADDGSLSYVSNLPLAISAKVSSGDAAINAAIRALNAGDVYTIARVSCFKDDKLARTDRNLAVTTNSGYRWTDSDGVRWISPASEAARSYLAGVCVELAELGFDEIVLDHCGYPTQGNLNYIRKGEAYDKATFASVIGDFYAQVAGVLEGYNVKLSILTDGQTVAAGANELSGQTVEAMCAHADRLWAPDLEKEQEDILLRSGMEKVNVVKVTGEPDSQAASWALSAVQTGG